VGEDPLSADRFLVEQLIRPVANLYAISSVAADEGRGEPVAFARQKRLALKEDLRFFRDETEQDELFRIAARQIVDVRGRYDVLDPTGTRIGVLERRFKQSLVRSTWGILDASEHEIGLARERSLPVALVRRVKDLLPWGEVIPIPYHFTILQGERTIGEVRRVLSVRDRYVLDLSHDVERVIDRRLGIALAIALDALQSR
jgi:uncharacterized protein YxjI